ncbi:MAG: hypothetical protein K6A44_05445 [bacterium]|nr:hypothetical protein [bacterium]
MSIDNIFNFIGITIGENSSCDSGICVINRDNEIVRIDKAYSIDELKDCVAGIAGKKNSVICIDMPEYYELLEGKWRISNKAVKPLKIDFDYQGKDGWTSRYSDRGSDFYRKLLAEGYAVYRYCSNFTKTILELHPYMKERTPAGCKFLQMAIKEKLGIKNFPPNMLPVSVLDAILGAYIAQKIANGTLGVDYEVGYKYKDIDIISLK